MIELKNISVRHAGGATALDSVSAQIGANCAVLGANGAGKTTLLWAIAGLLSLSEGEIFLDGVRVEKRNAEKVRKKATLVFQNPDDQLFFPMVGEDVAFGCANRGLSAGESEHETAELLADFGIAHLKNRHTDRLSDGEKKRAAVCAALACRPEILLLDEPSALLDPKSKRETAELLKKLPVRIVLTTHDLDFAAKICPRAAVLKNGKLAAFGGIGEILADTRLLLDCGLA